MNDAYFVFGLIIVAALAMATNRVRYDFIAICVVIALALSGTLSVTDAFAGFGHPVVILVGCLLIIGEMLDKTGVAREVGEVITKAGGTSQNNLLMLLMGSAAILSCVMSSTAVVAIFIPIVIKIAEKAGIDRSALLLPVAYAALTSGMITLIATPPNLVINDLLLNYDQQGLGFFEFAPIGVLVLIIAMIYFSLFGSKVLKSASSTAPKSTENPTFHQLWSDFNIDEKVSVFRVNAHSSLIDLSLAEARINSDYGVRVLAIVCQEGKRTDIKAVDPNLLIRSGNCLVVTGKQAHCDTFCKEHALTPVTQSPKEAQHWLREVGAGVLLVHPKSNLVNQTVIESQFRTQYMVQVMAIKRHGELIEDVTNAPLKAGDMLFVVGAWKQLKHIRQHSRDLIFLELPDELKLYKPEPNKMPIAIGIVSGMILLKLLGIVPIVIAALLAVIASLATRCLSVKEAYRSVDWSSLVLIAGMLPLATALEQTGGSSMIVDGLLETLVGASPSILLGIFFTITMLFTLVLSNTTSAVLMTPIAMGVSQTLGISPYPLAIAVLMGASTAFASPVSTSVVTIVVEPGQYKFTDFVRAGLPLTVITGVVTVLVTPLLFPF